MAVYLKWLQLDILELGSIDLLRFNFEILCKLLHPPHAIPFHNLVSASVLPITEPRYLKSLSTSTLDFCSSLISTFCCFSGRMVDTWIFGIHGKTRDRWGCRDLLKQFLCLFYLFRYESYGLHTYYIFQNYDKVVGSEYHLAVRFIYV